MRTDQDGVLNVWVRGADEPIENARKVTDEHDRPIREFWWGGDNESIIYLMDTGGNEDFRVRIANINTLETKDVTPPEGVRANVVHVSPDHPDHILVEMNKENPEVFDVYRVQLSTGAAELDTKNVGGGIGYLVDNDQVVRGIWNKKPDGTTEVLMRPNANSEWKPLVSWGKDETLGSDVGFTPDNRHVLFLSSVDSENAQRLLKVDTETGHIEVVYEDPQSHWDVEGATSNPKTHEVDAVFLAGERKQWVAINHDFQRHLDALHREDADFEIVSRSQDDKTLIAAYSGPQLPLTYVQYNLETGDKTNLGTNRPKLLEYPLQPMHSITATVRDGREVQAYLTLPADPKPRPVLDELEPVIREMKPVPMVILVHGGPQVRDAWGMNVIVQWLANRGYAVLQVNYRGSTGEGKDHLKAGFREWGRKMSYDLYDMRDYVLQHYNIDPDRVAIMGGSYGGYATLAAIALHNMQKFRCAVDIVGISNLRTMWKSIPKYWAPFRAEIRHRWYKVSESFMAERSPLDHTGNITTPLLVQQGKNDPRVKKAESDQIVESMRKRGQYVEYNVFNDGHGWGKPSNAMVAWAIAERFLAKFLGGLWQTMTRVELRTLRNENIIQ